MAIFANFGVPVLHERSVFYERNAYRFEELCESCTTAFRTSQNIHPSLRYEVPKIRIFGTSMASTAIFSKNCFFRQHPQYWYHSIDLGELFSNHPEVRVINGELVKLRALKFHILYLIYGMGTQYFRGPYAQVLNCRGMVPMQLNRAGLVLVNPIWI